MAPRVQVASIVVACALGLAACGGGGGSFGPGPSPSPEAQSAGGIWHALVTPSDTLSLFIAETGELFVQGAGPAFGSGAVVVNAGNEVAATYRLHTLQIDPTAPRILDRTCDADGTVRERISLALTVRCTDDEGGVVDRSYNLTFDPSYRTASSLEKIMGTYQPPVLASTNVLTIHADGEVFGMLQNGPIDCTVNGRVEIIDSEFNLYRFVLEFSLCMGLRTEFEGASMTGLAFLNPPATKPGSFLLMASAVIDESFQFISMLYEPT